VIDIRACTAQIDDRIASDGSLAQPGGALEDDLSAVENELYQTKLRAGEDPLNFPIKLNDKIAALHGVIESVDGKPTDQTFEVYDLLAGQLQVQLDKLAQIVAGGVPSFNQLVQARGLAPISCNA
jgi:hypothetical protein